MNNKKTVAAVADRTGVSTPLDIGITPGKQEKLYAAKRKLKKGEAGMDNPQPDAEITVSEMPMGPGEVANFAIRLHGSPALRKLAKELMENPAKDKYIPSARIHGGNILVDTEEEASRVVEGLRADLWKSGIKDQRTLGKVLYASKENDLKQARAYADMDMAPAIKLIPPVERRGRSIAEAPMVRSSGVDESKLQRVSKNPAPLNDQEEDALATAWSEELDKHARFVAGAIYSGDAKAINEAKQAVMDLNWPKEYRDEVMEILRWNKKDLPELIEDFTKDEY